MERFDFYIIANPSEGCHCDKVDTEAEAHEIWSCTLGFDEDGDPTNPVTVWHVTDDVPARIVSDDFMDKAWEEVEEQRRIDELGYVDPHKEHRLTASQLGVGRFA